MVSIVVPIYNVEDYIRECIDSIINQTYNNLEIILVDDGSPDSCPIICDQYASLDPRVKVIHKENGGLSSARNAGIEVASGEWIVFVDSDDYINKSMIAELLDLQNETQAQIVVCDFCSFNDGAIPKTKHFNNTVIDYSNFEAIEAMFYRNGIGWTVWNKLYDISLFESIRFPEGVYCEDSATLYKLYLKANLISYSKQKLYYYRIRQGSIMNTMPDKLYDDILSINDELCSDLKRVSNHLYDLARGYVAKSSTQCYLSNAVRGSMNDVNAKALEQMKNNYKYAANVAFLSFPERAFVYYCGHLANRKHGERYLRIISPIYKAVMTLIKVIRYVIV